MDKTKSPMLDMPDGHRMEKMPPLPKMNGHMPGALNHEATALKKLEAGTPKMGPWTGSSVIKVKS